MRKINSLILSEREETKTRHFAPDSLLSWCPKLRIITPYPSVLDLNQVGNIKLENSNSTNCWIFSRFQSGFLLPMQPVKIPLVVFYYYPLANADILLVSPNSLLTISTWRSQCNFLSHTLHTKYICSLYVKINHGEILVAFQRRSILKKQLLLMVRLPFSMNFYEICTVAVYSWSILYS